MIPEMAKTRLMLFAASQAPNQPSHAEEQHEEHPRDDRRDGDRQVDQGDEQTLAAELEFRDRPCRGEPEAAADRLHHDGRREKRQADGGLGVGVGEAAAYARSPFSNAVTKMTASGARSSAREGTPRRDRSGPCVRVR